MGFFFNDKIPIYIQMMDVVKQNIANGNFKSGAKLPSVREMAEQYGINPNTIQRTYQELERDDIVFTERGLGTFVTKNHNMIEKTKKKMAVDIMKMFIEGMEKLDFNTKEAVEFLQIYIEKEM